MQRPAPRSSLTQRGGTALPIWGGMLATGYTAWFALNRRGLFPGTYEEFVHSDTEVTEVGEEDVDPTLTGTPAG